MRKSEYNYLVARRRYIDARRRYMDDEVEGKISKIQSLIDKVKGKLMASADDPRVKKLLKILKIVGVSVGAIGGAFLAGNLGGKAGLRIAALASIAKEGDGLVKTLSSDTVRDLIGTGTLYACGAIFSLALSVASIAKSRSIGDSSIKLNAKRNKKRYCRRISDSVLTDFISKAVDRVSKFAADNPKKAIAITTIAPTLAYLLFKIAGQLIDAAREIKKIKSGQFDERQFVENYKKEFNSAVDRAKLELVKRLGPEGRRPGVINQYLDDALEEQAEVNRCRTIRELADVCKEIRLKRIADALDSYKSQNNIKDSAKLLGAARLMKARLPGATFCSRR